MLASIQLIGELFKNGVIPACVIRHCIEYLLNVRRIVDVGKVEWTEFINDTVDEINLEESVFFSCIPTVVRYTT